MAHEVVFERFYGTRTVATHSGDIITAVSQPDWESTLGTISELDPQQVGRFVLTPELVTSTDVNLANIGAHQATIESRVNDMKEITQRFPEATLLLGTAAFDNTVEKPRNAVLFLRDGEEVGRTYKANPIVKQEIQAFQEARPGEIRKPARGFMSLICSDLAVPPVIDADVETVLISSCWSTPSGYPGVAPTPENKVERYTGYFAGELLDRFDNVQTVIMADRLPPLNNASGPYNFVAKRQQA